MSGDTTASFARDEANKFYSQRWLFYASKNLVFQRYGRMERMPMNVGSVYRFKKLTPPTVPTDPVPLTEGVTPPPINLARTEVRADVVEFGQWLQETNRLRELFEDGKDLNALQTKTLGEFMVEERDKATYNIISMGTNVQYANGSARSSVNTVMTKTDFDVITRTLRNGLNGRPRKPIKAMLRTDGRFGTVSIQASYIVVIHPDLIYDAEQLEGWASVADYGQTQMEIGEEGKMGKYRFVVTELDNLIEADAGGAVGANNVKSTTGTNADVYKVLVIADDSYACLTVAGKQASALIRKTLGSGGTGDPLDQRGTVGYRMYFACAITYQEGLVRYEVAATDTPGA